METDVEEVIRHRVEAVESILDPESNCLDRPVVLTQRERKAERIRLEDLDESSRNPKEDVVHDEIEVIPDELRGECIGEDERGQDGEEKVRHPAAGPGYRGVAARGVATLVAAGLSRATCFARTSDDGPHHYLPENSISTVSSR